MEVNKTGYTPKKGEVTRTKSDDQVTESNDSGMQTIDFNEVLTSLEIKYFGKNLKVNKKDLRKGGMCSLTKS